MTTPDGYNICPRCDSALVASRDPRIGEACRSCDYVTGTQPDRGPDYAPFREYGEPNSPYPGGDVRPDPAMSGHHAILNRDCVVPREQFNRLNDLLRHHLPGSIPNTQQASMQVLLERNPLYAKNQELEQRVQELEAKLERIAEAANSIGAKMGGLAWYDRVFPVLEAEGLIRSTTPA